MTILTTVYFQEDEAICYMSNAEWETESALGNQIISSNLQVTISQEVIVILVDIFHAFAN